jgi:hypothetical protein
VYDTKYGSTSTDTAITTATATATVLMRYVWHWLALGFNGSASCDRIETKSQYA